MLIEGYYMFSIGALVEGFILDIIITVILSFLGVGTVLGYPIFLFGFFLASIIVGYISYGNIVDGTIDGALMGVAGARNFILRNEILL